MFIITSAPIKVNKKLIKTKNNFKKSSCIYSIFEGRMSKETKSE